MLVVSGSREIYYSNCRKLIFQEFVMLKNRSSYLVDYKVFKLFYFIWYLPLESTE